MTFKMLSFIGYTIIVLFLLANNDDRQCVTARYLPTRGHTDNMDRLRELIQDILNSDPYAGISIVATSPLHENSNNNNNNNNNINNPDNYGRIRNVERDNSYDVDFVNTRKHNVNADNLDFVLNKGRNSVGTTGGNLKFNNPLISEDLDGYQRFLFKRATAAIDDDDDVDEHINKLNDQDKFKMNDEHQGLEPMASDHHPTQNDGGRQFTDAKNKLKNKNNNNNNVDDDENPKHQRQLLKLHKHKN